MNRNKFCYMLSGEGFEAKGMTADEVREKLIVYNYRAVCVMCGKSLSFGMNCPHLDWEAYLASEKWNRDKVVPNCHDCKKPLTPETAWMVTRQVSGPGMNDPNETYAGDFRYKWVHRDRSQCDGDRL